MGDLIDRLLDEVAAAHRADGSVEAMWARVAAQAPDVHAMMSAAIYSEGSLFSWWQDKPTQVLYRIVQLAALRQSQAADRITALEKKIPAADRLAEAWAEFDKPLLKFGSFNGMRKAAREHVAAYRAAKGE